MTTYHPGDHVWLTDVYGKRILVEITGINADGTYSWHTTLTGTAEEHQLDPIVPVEEPIPDVILNSDPYPPLESVL